MNRDCAVGEDGSPLPVLEAVERLVLTHVSPRYRDAKTLEQEARAIFANSYVAEDFMEMEVKLKP